MSPTDQRFSAENIAVAQRLLGLEPRLDLAVAHGHFDTLRIDLYTLRRVHGAVEPEDRHTLFQTHDGIDFHRLGNQADHCNTQVFRRQARTDQHSPRRGTHQRQRRCFFQGRNPLDQLHAIHARHQQIAEQQVIVITGQALQGTRAVPNGVNCKAPHFAEYIQ